MTSDRARIKIATDGPFIKAGTEARVIGLRFVEGQWWLAVIITDAGSIHPDLPPDQAIEGRAVIAADGFVGMHYRAAASEALTDGARTYIRHMEQLNSGVLPGSGACGVEEDVPLADRLGGECPCTCNLLRHDCETCMKTCYYGTLCRNNRQCALSEDHAGGHDWETKGTP